MGQALAEHDEGSFSLEGAGSGVGAHIAGGILDCEMEAWDLLIDVSEGRWALLFNLKGQLVRPEGSLLAYC